MTRIEVLLSVIEATAKLNSVEPTSIVVHEVVGDADRLLGPRLSIPVTISSSGNVQHVRPGARVVVLHSQDSRELNLQLAVLLEREVGFIVIPNANPAEEAQQQHPRTSSVWTGDGWKAITKVNLLGPRYVATVDEDHGTAVIFPGGWRNVVAIDELPDTLDWAGLAEHRAVWLGLVTPAYLAELLAGPVVPEVSEPETSTTVDAQPETPEAPAAADQPVVEPAPEAVEAPASSTPATSRRSRRRSGTGTA